MVKLEAKNRLTSATTKLEAAPSASAILATGTADIGKGLFLLENKFPKEHKQYESVRREFARIRDGLDALTKLTKQIKD